MRLIVVRHGVTDWNLAGRLQGRTDIDLNADGVRQIRALGRRLATLRIDRLFASPMRRATRTAMAIGEAHGRPLEVVDDLHEAHMGLWEGLTWDEIRAKYPDQLAARDQAGRGYKGHGGESIAEVSDRAGRFLERLKREAAGLTACVVTHAAPGRHLIAHATGDPAHHQLKLRNASLTILQLGESGATVDCLDDVGHL